MLTTYICGCSSFSVELLSYSYHAVTTPGNLEVFSSNDTTDSPQIFYEALAQRLGRPAVGDSGGIFPADGAYAFTIIQKLVERALTDDVPTLQQTSTRLSLPALYQRMQFDPYGRTTIADAIAVQRKPKAQWAKAGIMEYWTLSPLTIVSGAAALQISIA